MTVTLLDRLAEAGWALRDQFNAAPKNPDGLDDAIKRFDRVYKEWTSMMPEIDDRWLVTGHYLATDDGDPADAEAEVTTEVCDSQANAESESNWFVGATITHVEEHASEDSGGSSYLCDCPGVDTGRHAEYCSYLNLFRPV